MKKNSLLFIVLLSAIIAIVVVVALKLVGYENPTVIGGGVAGGVTGALIGAFRKKRTGKNS